MYQTYTNSTVKNVRNSLTNIHPLNQNLCNKRRQLLGCPQKSYNLKSAIGILNVFGVNRVRPWLGHLTHDNVIKETEKWLINAKSDY